MKKKTWEYNTAEIMDARFSGGFQGAGGNSQSLAFMMAAVSRLPDGFKVLTDFTWSKETNLIKGHKAVIADYGCALGDGTAALQAAYPLSQVMGYDISPKAMEIAGKRWPHITFEVGDILNPKSHDIVFALHVLEHMQYPHEVAQGLLDTHKIVVVVVPFITDDTFVTHEGAVNTKDWLAKLPEPDFVDHYNTVRADLEADFGSNHICEGNALYVWVNGS